MNVNPGKQIELAVGNWSGLAGFTVRDEKAGLSLPKAAGLRVGVTVEIDSKRWRVVMVAASKFVRGFDTAELVPADGA